MIPTAITAGASRVASDPLRLHAVATTPAGPMELIRSLLLHRRRPSPDNSWVGSCINSFVACSAFTHDLQTRQVALCDPLHRRLRRLCCLHRRSDCYRVERSSSRAGLPSRCGPAPFTAHCYLSFSFGMVENDIASLWPPFDMAAIQSINTRSRRGRCSSAERGSSSRSGRTPCAGGIRSSALQLFPLRRSEPHEPKCLVAPA